MSTTAVEVVVLCEDLQQEVFIRRFLQKRRPGRHLYSPVISPSGRGSGEQWVRERFPSQLKAHRSRRARRQSWLLVAIDADTRTLGERLRAFELACQNAQVPFRHETEEVVFIVPRRNIETWFAYLRGEVVNETDCYPRHDNENDCRSQVAHLDEMCRRQHLEPEPPPPSLLHACEEFQRLA